MGLSVIFERLCIRATKHRLHTPQAVSFGIGPGPLSFRGRCDGDRYEDDAVSNVTERGKPPTGLGAAAAGGAARANGQMRNQQGQAQ
jgi:hypothetical protein